MIFFYIYRLVFESIFIYMLYTYDNDVINQKNKMKGLLFCASYTTILLTFMNIPKISVFYRIIAIFVISFFFLFDQYSSINKFKIKYVVTYATFVNLVLRFGYVLIYSLIHYPIKLVGIYDYFKENIYIYQIVTSLLYFLFLFSIYKLHIIRLYDIKNLSINNIMPIVFIIGLLADTYVKYVYNNIDNDMTADIAIMTLIFSFPAYVSFYFMFCKLAKLKNIGKNALIDSKIESKIMVPLYCGPLSIEPLTYVYEKDKLTFQKKLGQIGISNSNLGYSQMVLCLIIISHSEKNDLNFERDVINQVSKFTETSKKDIYNYFKNIITTTWDLETPESLKFSYKFVDGIENKVPNVEEFLYQMAKPTPSY